MVAYALFVLLLNRTSDRFVSVVMLVALVFFLLNGFELLPSQRRTVSKRKGKTIRKRTSGVVDLVETDSTKWKYGKPVDETDGGRSHQSPAAKEGGNTAREAASG